MVRTFARSQVRVTKAVGTAAVATIVALSALVLLGLAGVAGAQEAPKARARAMLNKGIDSSKRGDYEGAAKLYALAEAGKPDLTATEQRDLAKWVEQNNKSLESRAEGANNLQMAKIYLDAGNIAEASKLLRAAGTNSHLSPVDKEALRDLNSKWSTASKGAREADKMMSDPAGKDMKSLLAAARAALARGELEMAESICLQADKVGYTIPPLFHPWSDTPAKVRRDILSARARLTAPPKVDIAIEKKDAGGFPWNPLKMFGGAKKDDKPARVEPKDTAPLVKGVDKPGPRDTPPLPHAVGFTPKDPRPDVAKTDVPPRPVETPLPAVGASAGNKARAIQLVGEGKAALDRGDIATAQKKALEAKALRAELSWYDPNPDRLLADIERRAIGGNKGVDKAVTTAAVPAPKGSKGTPAEARALVKEGRKLIGENKLEDAERLMLQAQGIPGVRYGLFEDNPDKLHADIKKTRNRRDQEEAGKLTAEARTLYQAGNYHEARSKALQAQKLHGAYSRMYLGDRADKLLEEIQRAEIKIKSAPTLDPRKDPGSSMARPLPPDTRVVAKGMGPKAADLTPRKVEGLPARALPGGVPASVAASERHKALPLLAEARHLLKAGQLVQARDKALEAKKFGILFSPDEDSPEACLLHINIQCDHFLQGYIKRSVETVTNNPGDPERFRKAQADLQAARQLAMAFMHDAKAIDQHTTYLQQAAFAAGAPPGGAPKSGGEPVGDAMAQAGRSKLDSARLELRMGNTNIARRLAEEAYNPAFGVQPEALAVLRSIDAEEGNQIRLRADKDARAGIDAFLRKDYRLAHSLFHNFDPKHLPPDIFARVRDIMSAPEMALGPDGEIKTVGPRGGPEPRKLGPVDSLIPVAAVSPEREPGDPFRAMEKIQVQQLRERTLDSLKSSLDLVSRGMHDKAIDLLNEQLDGIKSAELEPELVAGLKRNLESRLAQYRTLQAQAKVELGVAQIGTRNPEKIRNEGIAKQQQEVSEKVKLAAQLLKEGKMTDALACYKQARTLDPDNVAAQTGEHIVELRIRLAKWESDKARGERDVYETLDPHVGPMPSMRNPVEQPDKETIDRNRRRSGAKGYATMGKTPFQKLVEQKFNQQVNVKFVNTPLEKVLDVLRTEAGGLNMIPDNKALTEEGISLDQPVTHSFENLSLRSALNIILDQANLTYLVKEDYLSITSKRHASSKMAQRVYSVADLVIPVENHPTSPANSFQDAMTRHIASQSGGGMYQAPTPYMPARGLPPGAPVGSSGGLGTAFASAGGPTGGGGGDGFSVHKSHSNTIEEMLIGLIQNSVASQSWSSMGGPGTIQYYPLGMALVINQSPEVQEEVLALLDALRRLQDLEVAIEMKLVNVSEAFFERMGLDFDVNLRTGTSRREPDLVSSNFTPFGFVNRNLDRIGAVTGLTPAGTLTPDLNIPLRSSSFDFSVPPFGGYPGTLGQTGGLSLGLAFLSDIQVFMFMEAAQGDRRTQVMQAPKITVFNGQTANIVVQDQQFFLLGVTLNNVGAQLFFQPQNQPVPLGVNLQVTPVISADRRFVRLNLTPQMTNLASATVPLIPIQIPVPQLVEGPGTGTTTVGQPVIFQMFFQQPTFTQISVNTTVNVPDGGTVLLGGLKTMSEARNEFGPPILSKIPYINRLFKNVGYGREVSSLMIMVTPRIIINEEEEAIFRGELDPIPRE